MGSSKICSLDEILQLRARARDAGQRVIHCHGCFDVVHPGHIHHLQHARSLGDLLIVSVSSDANVSKGVNRPLIPDDLRCASLAALECVDAVYLNDSPTAIDLLNQLRPDVYVKGREYESSVDPRFLQERDTVIANGGEVFFSSGDVVYSSTALIGALRDTGAFNTEKVNRFCREQAVTVSGVDALLRRCRGTKVVVIGDSIIDRYHFCEATGIAGEGPMMALRTMATRDYDGGAAIVARHTAALGADTTLITAVADDIASQQFVQRLRAEGIEPIVSDHRKQLITKSRFIVDDQKVLKVDDGGSASLDSRREKELAERILQAAGDAACVIFADFGYGLITASLLDRIMPELRAKVPVLTADVSGKQANLLKFKGIDLLCPTERELRETLGDFANGLGAVVSELLRHTEVKAALITLGKQGVMACTWPNETWEASKGRLATDYLPALSTHAVDPLGAGDAMLAVASLMLACGATLQQAAFISSLASAVEVQATGNMPVSRDAILDAMLQMRTSEHFEPTGLVA